MLEHSSDCFKEHTPEDIIYTVIIMKEANSDMLADAGSIKAMGALPNKRFDIVCFSGISNDVNFSNAIQTAARVMKEDGVLTEFTLARVQDDTN